MNLLNIEYEKYKLNNGLEVILYKSKNVPLVALNIWYKVGSSNEVKNKTGLAHLFEHMMFQGSLNVPKEMHFKYIQEAGGNLNGSTSFDRTNYYEKVPSNFLDLTLWLESDRMGFMLPSLTQEKLSNQKEVVSNERLERYDNQPYGLAWEIILKNVYPEMHPYSWPTIGYLNDIKNYELEDVNDFFKKYYSPSNAAMIIAGDFETNRIKDLVNTYFGDLPSHKRTIELNYRTSYDIKYKLIEHRENVQLERIYLAWPTTKIFTVDDAKLDLLADVLSGSKSSKLYKEIVYDKELAQDITVFQFSGKYAGHFMISATAKPGVRLSTIKAEIFNILNNVKEIKPEPQVLLKSKNGIRSSFIYSLQNIDSLADQLNYYNFFLNEPNSFNYDLNRYAEVTEEDIQKVAQKYLTDDYIELQILPNNKD
ncbi:MAG: M16 family metallopeptidase [Syntrophothermus sp.]